VDAAFAFEETLGQLQGWLGEHVAVAISPRLPGAAPLQVAMIFGVLTHSEEPPDHVRAHVSRAVSDDEVFFFFIGEERRSHFVLTRALFESAELQGTTLGDELFAINLRGVRIILILHPNG
jgi:hypothetical protein